MSCTALPTLLHLAESGQGRAAFSTRADEAPQRYAVWKKVAEWG
ncbi:MAG: hypothetical protein PHD91_06575 [bacterium]|nr:hypothetical protein [bacterium]MDD4153363.1 hypothetical protein [bacterium]MDD4557763.1 hypothetical protein [bacterium]